MRTATPQSRTLPVCGVTVAIPVYNEERIIVANTRRVLDELQRLGLAHQVIVGSNGSTDATVRLGTELQREFAQVEFFHLADRGVGLAFREFVRRARFPFLVSLDMDLSADLAFLREAFALAGSHDIVVGSKKLAPQRRSMVRKVGSDIFLWCARCLTRLPYDDYSIGAKGYRVDFVREFIDRIDAGSSYVLDLCYAATLQGRAVACIPVACEDRRTSKFSLPREGAYKFARLFRLSVRERAIGRVPAAGAMNREAVQPGRQGARGQAQLSRQVNLR